jgi:hypothetical protein
VVTVGFHCMYSNPSSKRHKPPAFSRQCLYLLNKSFRI